VFELNNLIACCECDDKQLNWKLNSDFSFFFPMSFHWPGSSGLFSIVPNDFLLELFGPYRCDAISYLTIIKV
jgi:hypothetical protein